MSRTPSDNDLKWTWTNGMITLYFCNIEEARAFAMVYDGTIPPPKYAYSENE